MNYSRVFVKRIVSEDGTVVAEARSVVVGVSENESRVSQNVKVEVSSVGGVSSSSSQSSSTANVQVDENFDFG